MSDVVRTGRTNNLARRKGELERGAETKGLVFEVEYRTNHLPTQRGLEQITFEKYSSTASKMNGGLNKISPISNSNPKKPFYMQAAGEFLKK